jgi:arginyl-tRNA synthetase
MQLAKPARRNPREIAQAIIDQLPTHEALVRAEIAGPGFINFFIDPSAGRSVIAGILVAGEQYGRSEIGKGKRVQVEFVSANPTGPLHVGHGRGAAYGATVADLLQAVGFEVHREYYVNDAGRQMDILGTSIWLRYLELAGEELTFPSNGYKGDYVWDIAATLHREHGDDYRHSVAEVFEGVPADEPEGGDKELHIDALIDSAKRLLGDIRYRYIFDLGLNTILDNIRADLSSFGINYEEWYSERGLTEKGSVNKAIERLREAGHIYEKDGALWFRSSDFHDEKDRVVQRDNGQTTYFASDIAYHMEKLERGFDLVIDVWGADHHGYVPRVRSALRALGDDDSKLEVLLVQFANLYRNGEKVQMSTRSGSFVTLRELRQEVGADAARFFYVMRKCEQHLDFDLDLAKSQSADNPVYYIQYAHARIHSVMRQLSEKDFEYDQALGESSLDLLTESHEEDLVNFLGRYPDVVEAAALQREPHQLVHFLRDLANAFHTYYNAHQFIVEDDKLRNARLNLCLSTRQVLNNGLGLLGVSAPEEM